LTLENSPLPIDALLALIEEIGLVRTAAELRQLKDDAP
jgi:hypothetical protein